MSSVSDTQTRRRPRLGLIFAGMAATSVIATFSLLVAAVVIH